MADTKNKAMLAGDAATEAPASAALPARATPSRAFRAANSPAESGTGRTVILEGQTRNVEGMVGARRLLDRGRIGHAGKGNV